MTSENWASIVVTILVAGVGITASLIGIIFSWLRKKVDGLDNDIGKLREQVHSDIRSLTHRVNEARSESSGLKDMILQDIVETQKKTNIENERYTKLLERYEEIIRFSIKK